ncbi:glutamate racemase [Geopsychrobacter electrodiphilus]|uniref:glutamate racemase n=1 Tax=Geopsychrobacter electrodiphilus TaxID=225196 RepID=UPI0003697468|nr:glutamate racemase [Geopsychrobacter electrodiphilus]
MKQQAIGVFDSGVGGLTVCRELVRRLPQESFLYLGDTARVPYGTKSPAMVTQYAFEAAEFLCRQGIKLLVVACNTASAVALPRLREVLKVPVVGVIEPGARAAVAGGGRRVGVLGTEGTINSRSYEQALHKLAPQIAVFSVACPLFVPLAEEGWGDHLVTRQVAEEYLAPLLAKNIDTLVLGCTHYPLLEAAIRAAVGPDVLLVDSAASTALEVAELLHNGSIAADPGCGDQRFYVTDVPTRFKRIGSGFLGAELQSVEQVHIG